MRTSNPNGKFDEWEVGGQAGHFIVREAANAYLDRLDDGTYVIAVDCHA